MHGKVLSDDQMRAYQQDGYLILRGFFQQEEIERLGATARRDQQLDEHQLSRADGEGGQTRLAVWNQPGDGLYGMFARCEPIVGLAAQVIGEEPYHFHSKMIMKQPQVGGAFAWHQDYGYWYHHGLLRSDTCSVMIAVDKATKENGCLQVLRGSHHLGRIDHIRSGEQAGADPERIAALGDQLELIYCELDPGDIIVFHGNTLHRSDANRSDHPRWCMICCYNARTNSPFKESQHSSYEPIDVVPRTAIMQCDTDGGGAAWLEKSHAPTSDELADSTS
ncbi:phytanoyl-CoA dioxygenase family protein [Aeoliella sp.]|uniref:phytanoyl-CoA dioxygenase family protein n=1 Tax=Aeoliella sp. TaxID=2795800 RepID=UPI003CCC062E